MGARRLDRDKQGRRIAWHMAKNMPGKDDAGARWERDLHHFLIKVLQFRRAKWDPATFILRRSERVWCVLCVFVDDFAAFGMPMALLKRVEHQLNERFNIKSDELSLFVGVNSNRTPAGTTLHCSQLIEDAGQTLGLQPNARAATSPTPSSFSGFRESSLCADPEHRKLLDQYTYRTIVGKLLYAVRGGRGDVCYIVGELSRYQANYGVYHVEVMEYLVQFLLNTISRRLTFRSGYDTTLPLMLTFVDSSFVSDVIRGRTHWGASFFFLGCMVAYLAKKFPTRPLSSCEGEFMGVHYAGKLALHLNRLVRELTALEIDQCSYVLSDGLSAVYLNNRLSLGGANSRHMLVKYHWQQETNKRDLLRAIHIPGDLQCAENNTKPLHGKLFWKHSASQMGERQLICEQLRAIITAFAVAHQAERAALQGKRHPDVDDSGSEDFDTIHLARDRASPGPCDDVPELTASGDDESDSDPGEADWAPPCLSQARRARRILLFGKRYSSDCTGDGPGQEQKERRPLQEQEPAEARFQFQRSEVFAEFQQAVGNIEATFSQQTEFFNLRIEEDVRSFQQDMLRARRDRENGLQAQQVLLDQALARILSTENEDDDSRQRTFAHPASPAVRPSPDRPAPIPEAPLTPPVWEDSASDDEDMEQSEGRSSMQGRCELPGCNLAPIQGHPMCHGPHPHLRFLPAPPQLSMPPPPQPLSPPPPYTVARRLFSFPPDEPPPDDQAGEECGYADCDRRARIDEGNGYCCDEHEARATNQCALEGCDRYAWLGHPYCGYTHAQRAAQQRRENIGHDASLPQFRHSLFREGSVGLINIGPLRTTSGEHAVTASEVEGRSHISFATEMGLISDQRYHLLYLNSASAPRGGWTADSTLLAEIHAECIVHKSGNLLGACYHHPRCSACRTAGVIRQTFYAVSIEHAKAIGMRASNEFGCCHNYWQPDGGSRKNPRRNQGE